MEIYWSARPSWRLTIRIDKSHRMIYVFVNMHTYITTFLSQGLQQFSSPVPRLFFILVSQNCKHGHG